MPELPEVETIIRGLRPQVSGRRIAHVEFLWPGTAVGSANDTAEGLAGQSIRGMRRWGKYILFDLRKDRQDSVLVVHLRMTGSFLLDTRPGQFTRVVMDLEGGPSVVFNDMRKFGRWQWAPEVPPRLRELGPEPLEIGAAEFFERLKRRKRQIKALLLDQEFLRGVGNIYADEALFRARIHPLALTARISRQRSDRLHAAVQQVLLESIEQGGTTVINYVDSTGSQGYFQLQTAVYGKAGEACRRCGKPVRKAVIAGRGTHFCRHCQRA